MMDAYRKKITSSNSEEPGEGRKRDEREEEPKRKITEFEAQTVKDRTHSHATNPGRGECSGCEGMEENRR